MLKRIYIDNFRCFVNFEYRPGQKQLLLGANGSGKSSLLDAIRAIKLLLKANENPFLDTTRTRWLNLPGQIFEVEATLDGSRYIYHLENRFTKDSPTSKVYSESLKVDDGVVFEHINGKVIVLAGQDASSMRSLKTDYSSLQLAALSSVHVDRFLTWVDHVHCLYIDAYPDAMLDTSNGEDSLPGDELENLADWYRHLSQADLNAVVATMNSLAEVLDGFDTLKLEQAGASSRVLRASFKQAGKNVTYLLSELSPGQRQLVALYLILHALISRGETVFLDEVTSHVSLREIQPWLSQAMDAVEEKNGQLILTSHDSEVLNYWANDYGLLFIRKDGGHVQKKPFSEVAVDGLDPSETVARGWENE